MYARYLSELARPGQTVNPLFAFFGIAVESIEPGRAVLSLAVKPELIQGAGVAAGGVLATLLDEAMAHAIIPSLADGQRCATVELSTRYLAPVKKGQRLTAEARVVKAGKRVVFVEGTVVNGDGEAVARADASFMVW